MANGIGEFLACCGQDEANSICIAEIEISTGDLSNKKGNVKKISTGIINL